MGPNASREQQRQLRRYQQEQNVQHHRHHHAYENDENFYSQSVLNYATMDHRISPNNTDSSRITAREIQNIQSKAPSVSEICFPSDKSGKTSLFNSHPEKKAFTFNQNISKPKLGIKKSRSFNAVSDTCNVVTVQQLKEDKTKGQQRKTSTSSQISAYASQIVNITKSTSSTSLSQLSISSMKRKKIPDDVTFTSINPRDIQNPREIGKGQFGTVYKALYKGVLDVAIKTLHSQDGDAAIGTIGDYDKGMQELLYEAHIMTKLKHPNVLRIIGVTFFGERQQLSLVTDFMRNGSLLDYLRKNRDKWFKTDSQTVTNKLNKFSLQIFEAMCYLEERNVIHRDLAARNCLIGEDNTLKVGDFGLTKLTDCGLYKSTYNQSVFAPRWTAPEAIFSSKYSSRSDVWSCGITLWEIYTLGERPFGDMTNMAIKMLLRKSSENISKYITKPSRFGTEETYTHIILPCLTHNATMRPRFKDLRERLGTILTDRTS